MKESSTNVVSPMDPNRNRLLEGEDPSTRSHQQASRWIAAYAELMTFKDKVLDGMEAAAKNLPAVARSEIQELDINMAHLQKQRYQSRLAFWEQRRDQLLVEEANKA